MTKILRRIGALASLPLLAIGIAAPAVAAEPAPQAASQILPVPLMPVVGPQFRTCAAKTASGLGTSVLKAGEGPKPGRNDFVLVSYIGYLAANGQVFDQNVTAPLNLDNVIPGFSEGLQAMPRGSVQRLCIPAALGYGAQASAAIPANSDLVFQIELVDSKTVAEVEKMRAEMQQQQQGEAPAAQPATAPQPAKKP